ncbi:MAG: DNA ligase D [Luteimonas sp.]|nr:DNA ligase D [Luteimonas sp.]
MSLTEYRRKREFAKTREPEPGKRLPKGKRAIFVVQLHHASRRHYDFRLQVGDALKSWAVPKGPSYDPTVKRMAVEVEDHPVDYARFEGEIPKGQYGGGHVATFDTGVWATDGDPEAQLAKGHLRFELFGDKLKGGWHLVRSGKPARQPQWLLFKDKDRYAGEVEADDLLQDVTPPPDEKSVRKSAGKVAKVPVQAPRRDKARRVDWAKRAGAVPGAKAYPLVSEFFAPQLARLGDSPPFGDDWLHEAKWDGYRLVAVVRDGKARLWSRNALEWIDKVPELAKALQALGVRAAALDGELIAGKGSQADFGLLQATLAGEKSAPLSYMLFDLLHLDGYDLGRATQRDRKALLAELLEDAVPPLAYSAHVEGHAAEMLDAAVAQGLEGIISKRADAQYRGGRGDDWRKIKRLQSDEFAVVGFTAPKGSRSGFGALLLARPDAAHGWSYAGRVGAGFSNALLRTLTKQLDRKTQSTPTVHIGVDDPELRRAKWFPPTLVVEVLYRGLGNQGLLRQPSFKGVRPDKRPEDLGDSDRGSPARKPAAGSAKKAAAKQGTVRKQGQSADVAEFRLTSPTRVVYPDRKVTKQGVADYYLAMMEWLLPEVVDRPVSVVRCTQGVARPCFFQKHHTAGLEQVDAVALKEEAGSNAEYLVVRDASAVMELVQFNVLEFHPWGAFADRPDNANRIVFDLDPGPGVAWAEVVDAARHVRKLLQQVALTSFVRTSGGKGLHVVVPLDPGCDWSLVKPFAHSVAEVMAQMEPLRFVATASKRFRNRKIFVDYLRNGRSATSVASFSLRARPGAPVSMPLRWEELGRVKSGAAFDIETAVARMRRRKSHPWDGIDAVKQDLEQVGQLLEQTAPPRRRR